MKIIKVLFYINFISILLLNIGCSNNLVNTNINDNELSSANDSNKITQHVEEDSPYYNDFSDLVNHSDLIIKGVITDISTEMAASSINYDGTINESVYTVYDIQINKNYSNSNSDKKTIKLHILGGDTETLEVIVEANPKFNKDSEYLFFLHEDINEMYFLVNPYQGFYKIEINKLTTNEINSINLLSISDFENFYKQHNDIMDNNGKVKRKDLLDKKKSLYEAILNGDKNEWEKVGLNEENKETAFPIFKKLLELTNKQIKEFNESLS